MSIRDEINHYNKKIEDLTMAIKRALTIAIDRIEDEEKISGYVMEHNQVDHRFTVRKEGNTARFTIDIERYIQASVFHTEAVEAFTMNSGGNNDYEVQVPKAELHKLHRSFTTELNHLLDSFVMFVETECLGESE